MADIIEGHSVQTSWNDPDQNARMHMLIYNFECSAFLLSHVHHPLLKLSDQLKNSGIAVTRLTEIPEYYRNTRISMKNTGMKTPILALIKKQIFSEDDLENAFPQISFIPLFSVASDRGLCSLHRPICSNI